MFAKLMEDINLAAYLPAAIAWCDEQGVDSVSELKEVQMEEDLVNHLNIKPAKAKLMLKRITEAASELQILGFNLDGGETVFCEEDGWEMLKQTIASRMDVKEEFICNESGHFEELENFEKCVLCLQKGISPRFRRRNTLESVIQDLKGGRLDPLTASFLTIRVAKATFLHPPKYYTFDHRRLWCMWKASVPRIRIKVVVEGGWFNEFIKKADGVGHTLSELQVR